MEIINTSCLGLGVNITIFTWVINVLSNLIEFDDVFID
jgi:hypothetical protein